LKKEIKKGILRDAFLVLCGEKINPRKKINARKIISCRATLFLLYYLYLLSVALESDLSMYTGTIYFFLDQFITLIASFLRFLMTGAHGFRGATARRHVGMILTVYQMDRLLLPMH
jgi:hypothetical protein